MRIIITQKCHLSLYQFQGLLEIHNQNENFYLFFHGERKKKREIVKNDLVIGKKKKKKTIDNLKEPLKESFRGDKD